RACSETPAGGSSPSWSRPEPRLRATGSRSASRSPAAARLSSSSNPPRPDPPPRPFPGNRGRGAPSGGRRRSRPSSRSTLPSPRSAVGSPRNFHMLGWPNACFRHSLELSLRRKRMADSSHSPDHGGGAGFKPFIPADVILPELTVLPLLVGTLLGIIFGAS